MNLAILLPIFIGTIGILQGGLNRQIANTMGVAQATLISNFVTTIICVFFYMWVHASPDSFPQLFQTKTSLTTYRWWFIFPAIFGFLIVALFPYALSKVGAITLTIGLIGSQIVVSVLWDIFIEKVPINTMKMVGIAFAIAGVILTSLPQKG